MTYRTAREKAEARRKHAAKRLNLVALRVASAIEAEYPERAEAVTIGATTSNAPLIRLALADGDVFNITITKARK